MIVRKLLMSQNSFYSTSQLCFRVLDYQTCYLRHSSVQVYILQQVGSIRVRWNISNMTSQIQSSLVSLHSLSSHTMGYSWKQSTNKRGYLQKMRSRVLKDILLTSALRLIVAYSDQQKELLLRPKAESKSICPKPLMSLKMLQILNCICSLLMSISFEMIYNSKTTFLIQNQAYCQLSLKIRYAKCQGYYSMVYSSLLKSSSMWLEQTYCLLKIFYSYLAIVWLIYMPKSELAQKGHSLVLFCQADIINFLTCAWYFLIQSLRSWLRQLYRSYCSLLLIIIIIIHSCQTIQVHATDLRQMIVSKFQITDLLFQIPKYMNNELLTTISQKLQQVSKHSQLEKKREKEEVENLLVNIETSLQERRGREEMEVAQMHDKVQHINGYLDETVKSMQIQTSKESQQLQNLREEVQVQIENAQQNHQEKVQEIARLAQDKVVTLSEEIQRKAKFQKEKIEASLSTLSKKLITLQKQVKQESQNRKVGAQRLRNHFYAQLEQLKEVVDREQQRRVSSERKLAAMVEQIQQKLNQEIEVQSTKRKKNNEAMLKLIELSCQKIEQNYAE